MFHDFRESLKIPANQIRARGETIGGPPRVSTSSYVSGLRFTLPLIPQKFSSRRLPNAFTYVSLRSPAVLYETPAFVPTLQLRRTLPGSGLVYPPPAVTCH